MIHTNLRVAVLDVDGTMLRGSLGLRLIDQLHKEGLGAPTAIDGVMSTIQRYRGGSLSYEEMVKSATDGYTAAIQGLEVATVERIAAALWAELADELFPFVQPMIAKLRRHGLRPVIISSSPTAIVLQLARALGIADATGSVFATAQGRYLDRCELMPGSPGGKLRALRRVVGEEVDLAGSFALGNAQSDVCILEVVGKPLAFEPTPELAAAAAQGGWAVADRGGLLETLDALFAA